MDLVLRVEPQFFEVQMMEFPTPICPGCGNLMWVKKRVYTAQVPRPFVRLGYECLSCRAQSALPPQAPLAVPRGRLY
jgi:hypothetical protein